ncbi:unnamed protein product [Peniophora sp. CBMAI 1063]|nr:unnamed protein product [Peniophora sp. CBMAI 1063]
MTSQAYPRHMLVLIHGQLSAAGEDHLSQVPLAIPQDVNFLVLKTDLSGLNGRRAYVSIDWEAETVVQQILAVLQSCKARQQPISEISFFGFNMGGLIARYAVGVLFQMKVFSEIKPRNFDAFGTPHVGLVTPRNRVQQWLIRRVFPRFMEQMAWMDEWEESGRPVLDVMSDTNSVFFRGLALFESIRVYANATGDGMVPYMSAAIEKSDPFVDYKHSGIIVETYDEASRYPALIKSWTFSSSPPNALHPVLGFFLKTLLRRTSIYVLVLALIAVLIITGGKIATCILSVLGAFALYLAVITLIPAILSFMSIRSQNNRLDAQRRRLLDMSSVFPTSDELAEDGSRLVPSRTPETSKSSVPTTAPSTTSKTASHLTPLQLHAITNLNTLPQLHKELVWRPGCFTPHRALLGLGTFGKPSFERGGILRHWGDGLLY